MDILVPKSNLGINRNELPQVEEEIYEQLMEQMKNDNIQYKVGTITCGKLKPIQSQLNKDKILSILNDDPKDYKLVVSNDNYICDGHHRWAASLNRDEDQQIPCIKINMCIIDLINYLNNLEFTKSKEIHESMKWQQTD